MRLLRAGPGFAALLAACLLLYLLPCLLLCLLPCLFVALLAGLLAALLAALVAAEGWLLPVLAGENPCERRLTRHNQPVRLPLCLKAAADSGSQYCATSLLAFLTAGWDAQRVDFSRLDPCSLKRYQRYYAEELDVSPGSSKGELVAAIGRHFTRQARVSRWLHVKLSRPRASAHGLCQPMRSSRTNLFLRRRWWTSAL